MYKTYLTYIYHAVIQLTCIDTKKQVITTWLLGLIKPGLLADREAESNILDILLVFVRSAEYIREKPNPTPNLENINIYVYLTLI